MYILYMSIFSYSVFLTISSIKPSTIVMKLHYLIHIKVKWSKSTAWIRYKQSD